MPRSLLILLMALLLALRGLLGSAMAMESAPPPAPVPHAASVDGHTHCHDASTPQDDSAAAPCAACDICHTALFLPGLAAQAGPVAAAPPRAWPGAAFASAPQALALKPPIA